MPVIDKKMIEVKRLLVDLDRALHFEIKRRALEKGMTIRQWIEEAIVNQIKKDTGLGWE